MLDRIIPFLQPIAHLIENPDISEVMVNGNGSVFYSWNGSLHRLENVELDQKRLEHAAKRIARLLGQEVSESRPLLDGRMSDGSRVSIVLAPISLGGISLDIRKFRPNWFTLGQLVAVEAMPIQVADVLCQAVEDRETILIAGSTDSGKSTLARALIGCIPLEERLGVIEDTIELKIEHPDVFRFEARKEQRGGDGEITLPEVSIRELVKASLRHRPDRLIIGEVRGAEAFDLLDALGTGHSGSMSTIHANSSLGALGRLASLAMRADVGIPHKALQADIGDLIDIVVHVERRKGKRQVSEVIRVNGFDPELNRYDVEQLYDAKSVPAPTRVLAMSCAD